MKKLRLSYNRNTLQWSLVIFLVALVVRIIFFFQSQQEPLFTIPIMDMAYHHDWAVAIAEDKDFVDGAFFRAPLYPYLVGLLYMLFGIHLQVVIVLQIILGSLSAVLTLLIGNRLFGPKTGRIAGLITAVYGTLIFYGGLLLIPTLIIFLNLLSVYLLVRSHDWPKSSYLMLAGLCLGLSAAARPTVLLFAAAVFFGMIHWSSHHRWRVKVYQVLLFALALILPLVPITVRNLVKSHELIVIGTYAGLNLYIGNNLQSDGVSAKLPGARADWWGMMDDARRIAETETGHTLTDSEQSTFWVKKTIREIAGHPLFFARHMLRKFVLLFEGMELSNNFDLTFFSDRVPLTRFLIWEKILYLPFGLIMPLAVVGLFWGARLNRKTELTALFIAAYIPAVVLFFVTARYRLPIIPFLIVFAAYGAMQLPLIIRHLPKRRALLAVALLVGFLVLSNTDIYGYQREDNAQGYYTMAGLYAKSNNPVQEEVYYRRAIAADPGFSEAYNNLGLLLASQGKIDEALPMLEKAVTLAPDNFMLQYNLGYLYLELGRPEQAINPLQGALRIAPQYQYALNNLGLAYLRIGQGDSAVATFRKAVAVDPKFISAHYNLALTYHFLGQLDSTVVFYRNTVRINPSDADPWFRLGQVWLQQGQGDSARACFESFVRLAPPDEQRVEEAVYLIDSLTGAAR